MRTKILSIEDDITIQALIEASLSEYQLVKVANLQEAQKELEQNHFDALLLDIELPDGDGLKFYTKLAQEIKYKKIPTLFLTAHDDISNKLIAFSIGAEDFITKPFNPLELNARITSKLKKAQNQVESFKTRHIGDLEIDFDRQRAFRNINGKQKDLLLTAIEFKILTLLSKRLEQVYSRDQILTAVWGQTSITDRTVDSHVAHLRNKLTGATVLIDTVKNFGYRLILLESKKQNSMDLQST